LELVALVENRILENQETTDVHVSRSATKAVPLGHLKRTAMKKNQEKETLKAPKAAVSLQHFETVQERGNLSYWNSRKGH